MVRRLRPLLAHLAAQLLAIGVLSAIDALRTRYRSQGAIPRLPLPPVRIGDSAVQLYTDAVQLYTDGADLYAAMLHAIAQARTQILLETSIWKDDPVGRRFKQQLHRAATRGVTVYVSFDSVANRVVPRRVTRFAPPSRCSNSPCCRGPAAVALAAVALASAAPALLRPRPPQDPGGRRRGGLRGRLPHAPPTPCTPRP